MIIKSNYMVTILRVAYLLEMKTQTCWGYQSPCIHVENVKQNHTNNTVPPIIQYCKNIVDTRYHRCHLKNLLTMHVRIALIVFMCVYIYTLSILGMMLHSFMLYYIYVYIPTWLGIVWLIINIVVDFCPYRPC